jgi:hypothetical protein
MMRLLEAGHDVGFDRFRAPVALGAPSIGQIETADKTVFRKSSHNQFCYEMMIIMVNLIITIERHHISVENRIAWRSIQRGLLPAKMRSRTRLRHDFDEQ